MEVISSATQHSGRLRLFSRKESETVSPRFWTESEESADGSVAQTQEPDLSW